MNEIGALILQLATGVGLAACCGLRAFLPPFAVGLAGRLGALPLSSGFEWLESDAALVVFGAAVLVELLADKISFVDNALDALQTFVKPVAGAAVAAAALHDLTPLQATVLGLLVGGTVAGTVHLAKAKVRLVTSATTVGLGNPVVSLAEDAGVVVGSVLAIAVPLAVVALLGALGVGLWLLYRRSRGRTPRLA